MKTELALFLSLLLVHMHAQMKKAKEKKKTCSTCFRQQKYFRGFTSKSICCIPALEELRGLLLLRYKQNISHAAKKRDPGN
jgi:hypothetical protein